jgi:hypothetical protein
VCAALLGPRLTCRVGVSEELQDDGEILTINGDQECGFGR